MNLVFGRWIGDLHRCALVLRPQLEAWSQHARGGPPGSSRPGSARSAANEVDDDYIHVAIDEQVIRHVHEPAGDKGRTGPGRHGCR